MLSTKKIAAITGVLYIIGTAAGVASKVLMDPIQGSPDYLASIGANESAMLAGSLCVLAMGLALAMVPVVLYPVLSKFSKTLALGYVVFRGALETFTYLALVGAHFFLIALGVQYTLAGSAQEPYFQTLGALLRNGTESISNITVIVFSLGALMLYTCLFRSNLVPRWLSSWGLIAIVLHLITGFLIIFHLMVPFSPLNLVMEFPIFLQEMVMAGWLIVRGFNPKALAAATEWPV